MQFKPEQTIHLLRDCENKLAGGKATGDACLELHIYEHSHYCWREEHFGMQVSLTKKLKNLERGNALRKGRFAEQALASAIFAGALKGTNGP